MIVMTIINIIIMTIDQIIIVIITRSTIAEKLARALYQGDHHQEDVEVLVGHLLNLLSYPHHHHHLYQGDHHQEDMEVIIFINSHCAVNITHFDTFFSDCLKF